MKTIQIEMKQLIPPEVTILQSDGKYKVVTVTERAINANVEHSFVDYFESIEEAEEYAKRIQN